MKYLSLLFLLFPVMVKAQIQSESKPVATYKIYFETGGASLNEKDEKVLVAVLDKCDELAIENKVFVQLQAFTDDVGSTAVNEKIATQRAESVRQGLLNLGMVETDVKIIASKQLVPDPKQNIAEQRKQSRRVEINCYIIQQSIVQLPQKEAVEDEIGARLSNFFKNEKKAATQNFAFEAKSGMIIQGEKGTVLQISPNSFVYEDGRPVEGMVIFSLREAYTYGDMLLQNLSTSSNGRQLETGGMFFTSAKNLQGQRIALKEGATIQAILPGQDALLPGMEEFEAELDESENVLDWIARKQTIRTEKYSVDRPVASLQKYLGINEMNPALASLKQELPMQGLRLPREVDKPRFTQREPKAPKLKELIKPELSTIRINYPQRSNELPLNYRKRIQEIYKKQMSKYFADRKFNNQRTSQYKRNLIAYQRAKERFLEKDAAYKAYCEAIKNLGYRIEQDLKNFDYESYSTGWSKLISMHRNISGRVSNINSAQNLLQADVLRLLADNPGLAEMSQKINLSRGVNISEKEIKILERNCQWMENCNEQIRKKFRNENIEVMERGVLVKRKVDWNVVRWLKTTAFRLEKIRKRIDVNGKISSYQIRQIRKFYQQLEERCNFKVLGQWTEMLEKKLQKEGAVLTRFLEGETATRLLCDGFVQAKNELGILDKQDFIYTYEVPVNTRPMAGAKTKRRFLPIVSLGRLGGFNCDRLVPPVPTTEVEILVDNANSNTTIFVISEVTRSIYKASLNKKGNKFIASGIPKNESVRVVAVQINEEDAGYFVKSGMPGQLNNVKVELEIKSVAELRRLISLMS